MRPHEHAGVTKDLLTFLRIRDFERTELNGTTVDPAVEVIGLPEESHDEFGLGMMEDFVWGSNLLNPACVHDHNSVGDLQRFVLIVRDENTCDMQFVVKPSQPGAKLLANLRIKCPEGFVEQQHARLNGQGSRQRDPLSLPSR